MGAAATQPPTAELPDPGSPPPAAAPSPSAEAEPRGRLKLTSTATDDEFAAALAAATGQETDDGGWTWKELLSSVEGAGASDDSELGEALFGEVVSMGIDPAALLPRSRVDEIGAAVQTGDTAGAREVVRALAPAAIRRIARRLLSDAGFRARAQSLTGRYGEVLADATKRDRQGYQAAALLATNAGRAYLLLDAAAGQPG
jgi:hypothetical protein